MPTVLDKPQTRPRRYPNSLPQPYRFTRQEYYKMAEAGLFTNRRVELINGEIVTMSPQNRSHVIGIMLVEETLREAFGKGYAIQVQAPLVAGDDSEPEPDVAVLSGDPRSHRQHPTSALLVVEVSLSTLDYDREEKAALYARMGIEDYWIVNLNEPQLEVYRKPQKDKSGWRYGTMEIFRPQDTVRPLAAAKAKIKVADMLP